MARIDEPLPPRRFVFTNFPDPKPTIHWENGTTEDWDEYERKVFNITGVMKKGQRPTKEQVMLGAQATRDFVFDRVQSVSGFEVAVTVRAAGDDGAATRQLDWSNPDDRKKIVSTILTAKDFTGGGALFVSTVMGAHRPADADALAESGAGGASGN